MAEVESGGVSIGCHADCTQLMDADRNLQNSAAEKRGLYSQSAWTHSTAFRKAERSPNEGGLS
ncbi:hypothetical protein DPMN_024752 [Dreissena polymorpha]|uniref:Uncharacterized protein n=1 Tax=Dreissena polymorpha TaxID=45954 RepID=A0A9D4LPR1_DREPO|nr:hypothetical protein DPMN_024752 [Dreissena polymorpha]